LLQPILLLIIETTPVILQKEQKKMPLDLDGFCQRIEEYYLKSTEKRRTTLVNGLKNNSS